MPYRGRVLERGFCTWPLIGARIEQHGIAYGRPAELAFCFVIFDVHVDIEAITRTLGSCQVDWFWAREY